MKMPNRYQLSSFMNAFWISCALWLVIIVGAVFLAKGGHF